MSPCTVKFSSISARNRRILKQRLFISNCGHFRKGPIDVNSSDASALLRWIRSQCSGRVGQTSLLSATGTHDADATVPSRSTKLGSFPESSR